MKKASIPVMILLLIICFVSGACASETSFVVKLKEGNVPVELLNILTEVNAEHRLYTTDNPDTALKYGEYIEYIEENTEFDIIDNILPIEETDSVSLMSLRDPFYSRMWQLQSVNAQYAWNVRTCGNGVNVAVIDSGCSPHPDLGDALKGGYNVMTGGTVTDFSDNHGHGTHVTGIIAAQHNTMGIAGIAPAVNLYAIKITDKGTGIPVATVADAIYVAVDIFNCRVINMSLASSGNNATLRDAVEYAYGKGVIMACAAGNEGKETYGTRVMYPAGYEEVVSVGAVTDENKRADFSQKNDKVFVSAPGYKYISIYLDSSYVSMSGTSQACPIVAAAAAIMLSAKPDMTVNEFKEYIKAHAIPLEDDYTGCGLIDIGAMLKTVISEEECYISPMNDDGVYILNNTTDNIYAKAFLLDSNLENPYVFSMWIMCGDGEFVSFAPESGKVYLWTEKLKPLCSPREYTTVQN